MYRAGKVDISPHLAILGLPQIDHTARKLSADACSLCSEVLQTSLPQVILKCQPPICLDYRDRNRPQLHYEWFLQNLGKDFIQTNMHTTVVWTTINMISSQKLRVPIPMQQGAYQEVAGVSSLNSEFRIRHNANNKVKQFFGLS